jgi:hypothetical protein
LDVLPIPFGVGTGGGNEEEFWIFLATKPDDFAINRSGPLVLISPPPMATIAFDMGTS